MEQQTGEKCAPPVCVSSDLLVGFANTRPADDREDLLREASGLRSWLGSAGLPLDGAHVTRADGVAAEELRDAFVAIFAAHAGCPQGEGTLPEAESYFSTIARRYPLMARPTADGCTLVPVESGVPGAFGALFAAAADLAWRGAWERLKLCKDPVCQRAFFDKTRNSAGQFCTPSCASRMSARNYRSRLRGAQVKPGDNPAQAAPGANPRPAPPGANPAQAAPGGVPAQAEAAR